MFLSNPPDDLDSKDQDIDFTSLPLNEALQVSIQYIMEYTIIYHS